MAQAALRKQNVGASAFFVGNLCQDADLLFRFAFALSMNLSLSEKLVKTTYENVIPEIPDLLDRESGVIRLHLLRRLWELHHEANEVGVETGEELYPFLKGLDLSTRTILFLIDVFGLTLAEANKITKFDEIEIRRFLAIGRKKLIDFRFE